MFITPLVQYLKEAFSLGLTNDELNTELISVVEKEIEDWQLSYNAYKENDFWQHFRLEIINESIKSLKDELQKIKANPIDFTALLNNEAWDTEK